MARPKPDFKNMTPAEIRENISSLNREIRELRKAANESSKKLIAGQAATLGLGVPATIAFPPLGLGIWVAGTVHGMEKSIQTSVYRSQMVEAQTLRSQFKTVWRARPGRKFHDIDARVKRENERRAEKARQKEIKKLNRKYGGFGFKFE